MNYVRIHVFNHIRYYRENKLWAMTRQNWTMIALSGYSLLCVVEGQQPNWGAIWYFLNAPSANCATPQRQIRSERFRREIFSFKMISGYGCSMVLPLWILQSNLSCTCSAIFKIFSVMCCCFTKHLKNLWDVLKTSTATEHSPDQWRSSRGH